MSLKGVLVAREHPVLDRLASGLNVAKEGLEELLWPTRCVLCDVPGTLLCEDCRLEIPYIDALHACPYCGRPTGSLLASIATPLWLHIASLRLISAQACTETRDYRAKEAFR